MNLYKDLTIQEVKSHSDHRTFIIENTNGSFMEANEITATLLICLKDSSDVKDGINKFCTIYPNLDRSVINSFINDKLSQIITSMPTRSNIFIYQKLILNRHIVDSTYTNYPPNLLSEILVEKGIIGVLVYIWLLSLIIISIIRPGKNYTTALINSLILIVLLKDMTQATLQNSLSSSIVFVLLIAFGQLYQSDNTTIHIRHSSYPIFIGFAMVFTVFLPKEYFRTNDEKNTILAISELRKGNNAKTVPILGKSSLSKLYNYDSYPNLVLIGFLIQQNRYLEAQKIIQNINLDSGYMNFYKGLLSIQAGDTIKAITNFSRALCYMPSLVKCVEFQQLSPVIKTTILNSALDAINLNTSNHNAIKGTLLHYSGNYKKAEKYLKLALYKNHVLPIPYKLLGEEEKYKFLTYGAFHISSKNNPNKKNPKIIDLILHEYFPRYKIWYSIK